MQDRIGAIDDCCRANANIDQENPHLRQQAIENVFRTATTNILCVCQPEGKTLSKYVEKDTCKPVSKLVRATSSRAAAASLNRGINTCFVDIQILQSSLLQQSRKGIARLHNLLVTPRLMMSFIILIHCHSLYPVELWFANMMFLVCVSCAPLRLALCHMPLHWDIHMQPQHLPMLVLQARRGGHPVGTLTMWELQQVPQVIQLLDFIFSGMLS
jgi:hypothetical protein